MTPADAYARIAQRIEPSAVLSRRWPLRGGVSAHVEALELTLPSGATRRVVLRRHGAAKWKALPGDVAKLEFELLGALTRAGLPVPRPIFVETQPDLLGSAFFAMELVEGTSDVEASALPDALAQMAAFLRELHGLQLGVPLPQREDPIDGVLPFLPESDPVREALRALRTQPSAAENALLHGDYWPGNLLWRDGQLAAVIDWEDAAVGDPLSDLAGCRLELHWKYGPSAADAFTQHYCASAPLDTRRLAVWELYAATAAAASMSQWGLPPEREQDMQTKAQRVIAAARTALLRD